MVVATVAIEFGPKVCQHCRNHPYESENGWVDNSCEGSPQVCALRIARGVKRWRRECGDPTLSVEDYYNHINNLQLSSYVESMRDYNEEETE